MKELQLNNCEGLNCKRENEVSSLANRSLPSEGVRWRFVWWRLMEVCGSDEVEVMRWRNLGMK